ISLGSLREQPFFLQALVVTAISAALTVGVYLLVAGIVKMDDLGLVLQAQKHSVKKALGRGILWFAPQLLRVLSVLGTAAMFLVGGGIVVHGLPPLHHLVHGV